jgi:hypothetical protein
MAAPVRRAKFQPFFQAARAKKGALTAMKMTPKDRGSE